MNLIWLVNILRDNDSAVVMRFYAFFTSRAWHPIATRRRPTDGGEEKEKKAEGMRYTCGTSPRVQSAEQRCPPFDAGRTPREC
ncbi:unnamed protein product [Lasius platythorax]|uniref:Uncharacterized protein n=1 Tax=Lasius platythorax TaxID=488582 RepID=A0AAV2P7E8_9HYME